LVEPIHLMLEYLGMDYDKKVFNNLEKETWFQVKFTMGIEFPNLPYIIDGDVKMSESMAIMKYIARKGNMMPDNEEEIINMEVAEGAIEDFRMSFHPMCYNENFDTLKVEFLKMLPDKLANFNQVLGKRDFLAGKKVTYVDFRFAEILDHVELCFPGCLDKIANVKSYKTRFESLDKIAAYKKSDRFQKWPITGARAKWGGKNEDEAAK